jgi:hypothetical protein
MAETLVSCRRATAGASSTVTPFGVVGNDGLWCGWLVV